VEALRGMWSYTTGRHKGNPARPNWSANMRVNPGVTVTRRAMVPTVYDSHGLVTGLVNWIAPDETNYVIYQGGDNIWALVQGGSESAIYSTDIAWFPVFAPIDVWMYFCGWSVQGNGTYPVQIFDGVNTDVAMRAPVVITSAAAADSGPGHPLC
jgi:hypothetical protein